MRFRNYKNKYTNDNRIYSNEELYNMPLSELVSLQQELGSQYGSIGFPMESELRQSENVVYVHAYTRDDGTEVRAHWRSKPNTGTITGGASWVEDNQTKTGNKSQDSDIYVNQEKLKELGEEKYKALYPDEIAGVKRGKEMSFEEAGGYNVNPKFKSGDNNYTKNCQISVICLEARIRGYDVEALPYGSQESKFLSYYPNHAFIDLETKMVPHFKMIEAYNSQDFSIWLDKNIQPGARYMIRGIININNDNISNQHSVAHMVVLTKSKSGDLVFHDAMSGTIYDKSFVNKFEFKGNRGYGAEPYRPSIIRIDDKQLNPSIANKVLKPKLH